jgi:hypothetical protein
MVSRERSRTLLVQGFQIDEGRRLDGLVRAMTNNLDDCYLVASQSEARAGRWSWEIRRISKPLGVKLTADGFQSDMATQFAGKRALANFLSNLLKEERNRRKWGHLALPCSPNSVRQSRITVFVINFSIASTFRGCAKTAAEQIARIYKAQPKQP